MSEVAIDTLIRDLALILILGAVVTVVFKWIKQPVVLGYIVAGFLASPHFEYLPSVTTEANIEFWAQIGIVVLLFSLGLEFSFRKLLNVGGSAVVTALIIVIGMMTAGFCVGHALGFSRINCLFLGGMLSMSSTTIIIKAFTDLGLRQRKFASLVFAVLIVEDLFAVLMMVILSSIALNNSVEGTEMLMSIGKLVFFLIIWFVVGVYVLPSLLTCISRYLNEETLLIVSMGLCLGMAVFSVGCGFSLALGAFVMGSILAGTSYAERIEHVAAPVKDLFGSVFFISVGMMVNPTVIAEYWAPILLLSGVVIVGMILFGTFGMLVTGQSLKVAIESGFSLTQIGEFAFIIASLGMSLGVLLPTIYPIVVAVSVITTFTTPYFIRMADPVYGFVDRHLPQRIRIFLDRYTSQAATRNAEPSLWSSILKRYLWRVLLYSIILIAILLVSSGYLAPWLERVLGGWGRVAGCVLTLTCMAPFLLALSTPATKRAERDRLKQTDSRYDVPLIVMTVFRLVLALAFVVYTVGQFYSFVTGISIGLSVFLLLLMLLSTRLRRHLAGIEGKFINNLNQRELRRSGRNNNVVSDLHLAFMNVGYGCSFVGERLVNANLRRTYGVNVVSIQRGSMVIPVPGGNERIFPGDVIGVVGNDEQIQKFLPAVEAESGEPVASEAEREVKFLPLQLSESSPLVGKTIASADVRNAYKVLIIALERDDKFIPLSGSEELKPGDTLWGVGQASQLESLK